MFNHVHVAPKGCYGSAPYGVLEYRDTDGMSVVHVALVVKCATCGKPFDLARAHLTETAWQAINPRSRNAA